MKPAMSKRLFAAALILCGAAVASGDAVANGGYFPPHKAKYEITIRNLTPGQIIAPSIIIAHRAGFSLFKLGDAPTIGLATMAETGNPGVLADEVMTEPKVESVEILPYPTGSPPAIPPGKDNSTVIEVSRHAQFLTTAAMLGISNDAFYAVLGIPLPKHGKKVVYAIAYDAGSEANTEADGMTPSTPMGNDPGVMDGDGEGFIHVHSGINGGINGEGALNLNLYDWRNPVVMVTVKRVF